jgi:WS/DGAT/MGAT family acyltransferase
MQQLTGLDASFLALETPVVFGHTGGITVLDPSEAEDFGFEKLRQVVAERIRLAPRFAWKLREVPLGLDRPWWVEDPDFDVSRHMRRIAVPSPGGIRELAELASDLFARPLDRRRPLWEIWWIEGVSDGRVALMMKTHHCVMDGVAGAGLGQLLCDLEPRPASRPAPKRSPGPRAPGDWTVALRAASNLARGPFAGARAMVQAGVEAIRTLATTGELPPLPGDVPLVSWNGMIGPRRGFACSTVPLTEVKAVAKRLDVTVNDVLLALTSAALRRYLRAGHELPDRSLVAAVAASRRAEGDASLGNQVDYVSVPLSTEVADPVERLRRIHAAAVAGKARLRDSKVNLFDLLGGAVPPALASLAMRLATPAFGAIAGNLVVSTVRATPIPLYVAGARLETMYPMSLLAPGQGLNATAVSYLGKVDFGFTVDPDLVPDPWRIADEIPPALAELGRATGRKVARRRRAA